jgi:hypothetical protein
MQSHPVQKTLQRCINDTVGAGPSLRSSDANDRIVKAKAECHDLVSKAS